MTRAITLLFVVLFVAAASSCSRNDDSELAKVEAEAERAKAEAEHAKAEAELAKAEIAKLKSAQSEPSQAETDQSSVESHATSAETKSSLGGIAVFDTSPAVDALRVVKEMARSIQSNELNLKFILAAMKSPPEDVAAAMNSWSISLKELTGENCTAGDLYPLLSRIADIHSEQVRALLSLGYVWKLNGLSKAMVEQWCSAVEEVSGDGRSEALAAVTISNSAFLYGLPPEATKKLIEAPAGKSDDLGNYKWTPDKARWEAYIRRIRSLPRAAVIDLSNVPLVTSSEMSYQLGKSSAATRLAEVDSLFHNGEFQSSLFAEALPQLERVVKEAAAKRSTTSDAKQSDTPPPKLPPNWPPYVSQLTGENQVRIDNPNPFSVTVGLRSNRLGTDFVVPSNSTRSAFAPNGQVEVYFWYSNKPDEVYKGDDLNLANADVEIQLVTQTDGNYGIRKVKSLRINSRRDRGSLFERPG